MAKFLKLGDKAHTFYCPATGVNVSNKQVIRLQNDADIHKPSIAKALKEGHLVFSNEAEWKEHKATHKSQVKESQKNLRTVTTTRVVSAGSAVQGTEPDGMEVGPTITEEDDDEDEDTTDVDLEDDDDLTKSELIDKLKASSIPDEQKKNLTKASTKDLRGLWKSVKDK